MLDNGILPSATLYHWDLPQPLEDAGGWTVRDTAARYADYVRVVLEALGDRVEQWITLNEPWCSAILGYGTGRHAPGRQEGHGALAAAHHLLLGHALAVPVIRSIRPDAQVGVTLNLQPVAAASERPEDRAAAERLLMNANLIFTDPLLAGRYPQLAREFYQPITDFAFIQPGDLELICAPLDFFGVNYYFPSVVADAPFAEPDPARRTAADIGTAPVITPGEELTAMGWPIDPDGLRRLLTWLKSTYPTLPPIYITENGRASNDLVSPEGQIEDPERIRYVQEHLGAVAQAIAGGVDVRGYYYWSLLDNFEWAEGYAKRFGLVYIDYPTQRRTPKASYAWFRDLLATRAHPRR